MRRAVSTAPAFLRVPRTSPAEPGQEGTPAGSRGRRVARMSNARLWLAFAGKKVSETMFPLDAPFFLKAWGTSRFSREGTHGPPASPLLDRKAHGFPTPLHAHGPKVGP